MIKGLTFRYICAMIVILLAKHKCTVYSTCLYYIVMIRMFVSTFTEILIHIAIDLKSRLSTLYRENDWHIDMCDQTQRKKAKHDVLMHRYILMNICFRIDPRIDVYQHNAHVIMRHEN